MERAEVLIVRREDLILGYANSPYHEIKIDSFHVGVMNKIARYNIVLFIDHNGDIYILKNRYGSDSKQLLGWMLNKQEKLTQRYIEAETFISNLGKRRPLLKRKCLKYINKALKKYDF
jgi:hypothetical protein